MCINESLESISKSVLSTAMLIGAVSTLGVAGQQVGENKQHVGGWLTMTTKGSLGWALLNKYTIGTSCVLKLQ